MLRTWQGNLDIDDSPYAAHQWIEELPQITKHGMTFNIFGGGGGDASAAAAAASAGYERAAKVQKEMYEQTRADMLPGIEAYAKTVPYLGGLLGIPGYDRVDPTATLRATPGYEFSQGQGQDALARYAAARGLSMSPSTLKAMQTYGQGLGDQTYQQYLSNISNYQGAGQNAAAQTGTFGTQTAQGMGQAYIGEGNAQANAILAQGLQRQSGYGGLGSLLGMGMSFIPGIGSSLSNLFGGGSSGTGYGYGPFGM